MKKLQYFAHRGECVDAPENTLLAIEKALAHNAAPWIEVDVWRVENELIVIHDKALERATNGTGEVGEQTLQYLKSLNAGKGQSIPWLREVFELVNARAGINVELKGYDTAQLIVQLIEEYVSKHNWSYDQFLVSSFNHHELKEVKSIQPKIKIGALIKGLPLHYAKFAEELGAYSVHTHVDYTTKEMVDDAHKRKLKVFVYVIESQKDLKRMRELDVDGIFINDLTIIS